MSATDLIPRRAEKLISAALEDTRVVLISGARQSGKSTLVRLTAGSRSAERRDLDREQDRAAALADPTGFVAALAVLAGRDRRQPGHLHRRRVRPGPGAAARVRREPGGLCGPHCPWWPAGGGRAYRRPPAIFLVKRIPGWSRNLGRRVTQAPKLVFVDSGIAAQQLALDPHQLLRPGQPFGPLLEGFVISELARQATWSDQLVELYHYRDQQQVEVDIILENRQRQVVAIEVKASSTVRSDDFRGIRQIADRLGDDLIAGIVLYTGTSTLPFGDKLRAVPVSALWQVS